MIHSQELDSHLETLTSEFEKATSEKLRFQEEVNYTNKTIELANRLVKGLEVSAAVAVRRSMTFSTSCSFIYFHSFSIKNKLTT